VSDETRYFAAVLTMALHTARPDLRAEALARLTAALGDGAPAPGRGIYIHDGTRIVHATAEAATLLGGTPARIVGRPSMSMVHPSRRPHVAPRIAITMSGNQAPVWRGPLVRLDGRTVLMDVIAQPIVWEGRPASQIALVDLTNYARLA
jgi:PAS domain S-box-containing protein